MLIGAWANSLLFTYIHLKIFDVHFDCAGSQNLVAFWGLVIIKDPQETQGRNLDEVHVGGGPRKVFSFSDRPRRSEWHYVDVYRVCGRCSTFDMVVVFGVR